MSTPRPRQIQKQAEEAAAIMASLNTKPGEAAPGTTAAPTPDAPPATTTAPAADPPPAAPVVSAAPAPTPAPPADDKDYKQLYTVLKGKYDKEVPELRVRVADAEEAKRQTETLLAQLAERQPVTKPAAASKGELPKPASFTDKELDEYGPEFMDVAGRRADEIVQARLGPLMAELEQLRGSKGHEAKVSAERARDQLYIALNENVPGWDTINTSPGFLAWLANPDVLSGKVKRELLTEAFQANDAARVVGFFKAFQEDSARQPTPAARQPAVDPGTLVAPGTPRSGAPAGAPGGSDRVWTHAEIADFYTQVRLRKISPDQKILIEKEIVKAAAEGRVR